MNSTPGPQEHDDSDQAGEREAHQQDERDQKPDELVLGVSQVLELLDSQAAGIHEEIQTVTDIYGEEGELPASEINSIRTEVMELQFTVEDYLAANCDGTRPWDHAGELIPREHRDALRGGA